VSSRKIAIVHDWLVAYGGAELVLKHLLAQFPDADLYCIVDYLPTSQREFLRDKQVNTSFIQKMPFAHRKYRSYLPLMPFAVEQFDLSKYDIVISSSHAVAKGVLTGPDQLHFCICYTPLRYAWDLQHQYLKQSGLSSGAKGWLARKVLHDIRQWDYQTANGVDHFIAISHYIARRIWKVYRRTSTVIYPPVDTDMFTIKHTKQNYYMTASRMVPYKRVDLIIEAFNKCPERKLIVIGDGPELRCIKSRAGSNTTFLGYQSTPVLVDYLQNARAFIFAAEDDFGIAPLEAQACGTPVIAFGKGGALETIFGPDNPNPTGIFFKDQNSSSLLETLGYFEQIENKFSPDACRENAMRFSTNNFTKNIQSYFDNMLNNHYNTHRRGFVYE
jgi:glycosyltransferase involved in cell wall biosynthesis